MADLRFKQYPIYSFDWICPNAAGRLHGDFYYGNIRVIAQNPLCSRARNVLKSSGCEVYANK